MATRPRKGATPLHLEIDPALKAGLFARAGRSGRSARKELERALRWYLATPEEPEPPPPPRPVPPKRPVGRPRKDAATANGRGG